jgi:hypothetical protein
MRRDFTGASLFFFRFAPHPGARVPNAKYSQYAPNRLPYSDDSGTLPVGLSTRGKFSAERRAGQQRHYGPKDTTVQKFGRLDLMCLRDTISQPERRAHHSVPGAVVVDLDDRPTAIQTWRTTSAPAPCMAPADPLLPPCRRVHLPYMASICLRHDRWVRPASVRRVCRGD